MESNKKSVSELLGISMEKIREMADVNSIIGDPITTADGSTVIPVSKVTYGFASGGSDLPSKYAKDLFAGGAGGGMSIKPEGFLVISSDGAVNMITVDSGNDSVSNVINSIPNLIEKIQKFLEKRKEKKAQKEETDISFDD